jgi:hypothetical protein
MHLRREKVVDESTGEAVGFVSFILPNADVAGENEDGASEETGQIWPEAHVPEVDDETRELMKKRYDEVDWKIDHAMDVLDSHINELRTQVK